MTEINWTMSERDWAVVDDATEFLIRDSSGPLPEDRMTEIRAQAKARLLEECGEQQCVQFAGWLMSLGPDRDMDTLWGIHLMSETRVMEQITPRVWNDMLNMLFDS